MKEEEQTGEKWSVLITTIKTRHADSILLTEALAPKIFIVGF
jgi:hypothetical protein